MKFLESDLEEIICKTQNEKLQDKGLFIEGEKLQQLRIGNYGVSDIVSYKRSCDYVDFKQKDIPYRLGEVYELFDNHRLDIQLFELKKDKISLSALMQAVRYCKGINSYMSKHRNKIKYNLSINLVGKEIDLSNDLVYLSDLFSFYDEPLNKVNGVNLYTYDYGFDGIEFKDHGGYKLNEEGF